MRVVKVPEESLAFFAAAKSSGDTGQFRAVLHHGQGKYGAGERSRCKETARTLDVSSASASQALAHFNFSTTTDFAGSFVVKPFSVSL